MLPFRPRKPAKKLAHPLLKGPTGGLKKHMKPEWRWRWRGSILLSTVALSTLTATSALAAPPLDVADNLSRSTSTLTQLVLQLRPGTPNLARDTQQLNA